MSKFVKIESERYMDLIRDTFALKRRIRILETKLSLALQAFEVISNVNTLTPEKIAELCKTTKEDIDSLEESPNEPGS